MKRLRRNHDPAFKTTVALAVLKGNRTLAELPQPFVAPPLPLPPQSDRQWESQLLQLATDLFATPADRQSRIPDIKALHAKIDQRIVENDSWGHAFGRLPDASAKR